MDRFRFCVVILAFFLVSELSALDSGIPCEQHKPTPLYQQLEQSVGQAISEITRCSKQERQKENQKIRSKLEKKYRELYPGEKDRPLRVGSMIPGRIADGKRFRRVDSIKGSAEEIDVFKKVLGGSPPEDWKKRVKDCETVLCALDTFTKDREASLRLMTMPKVYGYAFTLDQKRSLLSDERGGGHTGSPKSKIHLRIKSFPKLKESIWKRSELRKLEKVLSKLPSSFHHLAIDEIVRLPDGYKDPEHSGRLGYARSRVDKWYRSGDLFDGLIHLFELAREKDFSHVFLHELAHHYDFKELDKGGSDIHLHEKIGFIEHNHWVKAGQSKDGQYHHSVHSCFIDTYQTQNPMEDFADKISYYVQYPHLLRDICPENYEFIKENVFNSKEYLNESVPPLKDFLKHYSPACFQSESSPIEIGSLEIKGFNEGSDEKIEETCLASLKILFYKYNQGLSCELREDEQFQRLLHHVIPTYNQVFEFGMFKAYAQIPQKELQSFKRHSLKKCKSLFNERIKENLKQLSPFGEMNEVQLTRLVDTRILQSPCSL
jgi:hypothetical protein